MFDSLEEQIKSDDDVSSSRRERVMQYSLTGIIAVVVFAGLIFAIVLQG